MASTSANTVRSVRYEPHERPPPAVTLGLGLQSAMLAVPGIVVVPAVVVRAAGGSDGFLAWATFAALSISGVTTVLQAVRVGRVGAGHILLTGASGASIPVCILALAEGGPPLLATLVAVSALVHFTIAVRLSWLRRILTPAVSGTVIMLIPVTVMPILFRMLTEVPDAAAPLAAPASATMTLVVTVGVMLRAVGAWRLWAPAIGVAAGAAVAGAFGIYDTPGVAAADWVGLPAGGWAWLDLSFGRAFWMLLPAFVFVALADAVKAVGDGIAVQRVSWSKARAIDFRAVQGAVAANCAGSLLSGLAATMPTMTHSQGTVMTAITGVAARSVGVVVGIVFVALAFLPKFMALIIAVPGPVVGAYLAVLMATLFVLGMRMVVEDGADYRKGVVAGVSFWIGLGFQHQMVFADQLGASAGGLGNGVTTGGLAAILMTLFVELTKPRRRRIGAELDLNAFPTIDAFLLEFATSRGWSGAMTDRLRAVGEETLATLVGRHDGEPARKPRRLLLAVRNDGGGAELEFVATTDETNIEDRLALLGDHMAGERLDREVSLRLLRHLASSVRHQQFHDTEVVTVRVEPVSR